MGGQGQNMMAASSQLDDSYGTAGAASANENSKK